MAGSSLENSPGRAISRRTVLQAGIGTGLAASVGPFISRALAAEPIRIGVLLPKSGPYAVQGENGHNGAQVAVKEFGGEVLGRPIELVWLDEANPQTTVQNMNELIQVRKVVAVQGGISSGDVLAIMPIAERTKTLLMATGPNATEITGAKCNRYTFRVDLPNRVTVRTVYPSLSQHGKNWYFVSASYAWGIDAFNQMKDVLVSNGGKAVGYDQAPLGTTDYSSFILKVRAAKPDVVFLGLGGSDITNFLKQYQQVGLTGKIPISSPIVNDSDLWAAGPEAATGIYPKLWNYTGPYRGGKGKKFAEEYQRQFGTPPEVEGFQDYFGCIAILTAIRETKSTDSKRLVEFLEDHKFDGYKDQPIYFRSWDHQLIQPTLVAQVKPKITDKFDYFNVMAEEPGHGGSLDAFYGERASSECKLTSL
ncbi:ABC transporter substrate-binding protein [bacterium]|nr:MAG: ABC transporter substrate-binding protein [bacterium]